MAGTFREFASIKDLPDADKFIYKDDVTIGHSQSLSDIMYDILIVHSIPVWLTIGRGTIIGSFYAWDKKYRNLLFQPKMGERLGTLFLGPKNNYHWQVVDGFNDKFREVLQPYIDDKYRSDITNEHKIRR